MSTALKFVAIAGGGVVIAGLGYLAWDIYQTSKKEKEREANKSWWDKLKDGVGNSALSFVTAPGKWFDALGQGLHNFGDLTTIFKWVLVGGSVLIGLALIVFIGRMAMGNTPDPTQAISSMAQLMESLPIPQAQAAKMARNLQ